jgi:regulator of sigma E protease
MDVLLNIRKAIEVSHTDPVELVVRRDNEIIRVSVMPSLYEGDGSSADSKGMYILGITPKEATERYGMGKAVVRTAEEFYKMMHGIFLAIRMLITKQVSPKHLSGPIGIAKWGVEIARSGLSRFLYYMAFISVNLGVVNLLPFPVLDGGHLAGLAGKGLRDESPQENF